MSSEDKNRNLRERLELQLQLKQLNQTCALLGMTSTFPTSTTSISQLTKFIGKKSSWSVTNKMEFIFSMEVKAGIPEVAEVSTGFSFTLGTESTYGLENSEEKTELLSFPVHVPPGKKMKVDITIGRATVDLPYTGTVEITCLNGSVLEFQTSGVYKGLTYTDAKTVVKEI
ncbi:hypothetical protein MHYP_G00272300 [Metynnis hypsauchen]